MKHTPRHFTTGVKKGRPTVKTVGNTAKKNSKKNRCLRRYLFLTHKLELTRPNQPKRQQKWEKKKKKKTHLFLDGKLILQPPRRNKRRNKKNMQGTGGEAHQDVRRRGGHHNEGVQVFVQRKPFRFFRRHREVRGHPMGAVHNAEAAGTRVVDDRQRAPL
jgi:hypothetical protein